MTRPEHPPAAQPAPAVPITGHDLRVARESVGVGLGTLAKRIGKSAGHLSKVETGAEGREVTPGLIHAYQKTLGVAIPVDAGTTLGPPRPERVTHNDRCAEQIRLRALIHAGEPAEPDALLLADIADEIRVHCGHVPLKAYRLAYGWTVEAALGLFQALCVELEFAQQGLSVRLWRSWEAGAYRPNDDHCDLMCRLFQTSAVRLGFASEERHWQVPKAFRVQFRRAARELAESESDPEFGQQDVSDRQFQRWLDGAQPRPYACRVLEYMFDRPIAELMRPVRPTDQPDRTAHIGSSFGRRLKELREQRGLSFRRLGNQIHYSHGYLWDLETGGKRPTVEVASALDTALDAHGQLLATANASVEADEPNSTIHTDEKGEAMKRRRFVVDLGIIGLSAPLAAAENIRHRLTAFAGRERIPDIDEWGEISLEYARSFYGTPVDRLLRDLSADLLALEQQLAESSDNAVRESSLAMVGGQLAAIPAMAWASAGEMRHAGRWWRTARQLADRSGDTQTRMWVRGWEVANGLYEQRPVSTIVERAAESIAIGGNVVCAGTVGMYAGLAQTLAIAGRGDEAISALRQVEAITHRLPTTVINAEDSMFGWPEVRLRHTESFVYSWLGDTNRAYVAQENALRLYPENLIRERAAMLFHRAACMIHDGDLCGGVRYADDVLDRLPIEHHTELVYAMGRAAINVVPQQERSRRDVTELRARLALPAGKVGR